MKKWMLACAAVTVAGFMADPASAQEPIALPQTVVRSAEPIAQRGLFRRMCARRGEVVTVASQPVVVASAQAAAKPMPGTASGIQQAQATQPAPIPATQREGITTTEPQVMQIREAPRRMGLLARMRARRG